MGGLAGVLFCRLSLLAVVRFCAFAFSEEIRILFGAVEAVRDRRDESYYMVSNLFFFISFACCFSLLLLLSSFLFSHMILLSPIDPRTYLYCGTSDTRAQRRCCWCTPSCTGVFHQTSLYLLIQSLWQVDILGFIVSTLMPPLDPRKCVAGCRSWMRDIYSRRALL